MALFRYHCSECEQISYEEARLDCRPPCGECGGELRRAPAGPAADPRDRVDTGLLGRPVETVADAPRLVRERDPKNTVH